MFIYVHFCIILLLSSETQDVTHCHCELYGLICVYFLVSSISRISVYRKFFPVLSLYSYHFQ